MYMFSGFHPWQENLLLFLHDSLDQLFYRLQYSIALLSVVTFQYMFVATVGVLNILCRSVNALCLWFIYLITLVIL